MYLWLVLITFLTATPNATLPIDDGLQTEPLRYRGIEKLLAKFEAEADSDGLR